MCDDLMSEVAGRLVAFANEFHWRPVDVWNLTLAEFCLLADFVDDQNKARAEARRASEPKRGRARR